MLLYAVYFANSRLFRDTLYLFPFTNQIQRIYFQKIYLHQSSVFDLNYLELDNIRRLYFKFSFSVNLSSACRHLQPERPRCSSL
jgi:hypothetical protein